MGFFDGLFGKKHAAQTYGFETKLSTPLQANGLGIAADSLANYRQQINRGETDAETSLFSGSRNQSIQDYNDAVGNAGAQLHRQGMGSSMGRDQALAALSMGLGNTLTQQDAQRAAYLNQQRMQAQHQAIGDTLALAGQGTYIPASRTPGLFDGMGTKLIGGGISAGLGALGSGFGGAVLPSVSGFGSSLGSGAMNAMGGFFGGNSPQYRYGSNGLA